PRNTSAQGNFFSTRKNEETIDSYDIKIDHQLTDSNTLGGRFSFSDQERVRASFFPDVPSGFGAGEEVGNTRQLAISDTHIFRPTLLNEFRFGWTRIEIGILNCGVGGACGISATFCDDLGIPNCNKGTFPTTGSILTGGFGTGEFEFAGDGGPFIVESDNFFIADSVTIISGNHNIKFGGSARPRYVDTIDGGRSGGLKGHIQYAEGGVSTSTGNVQADYLLGRPGVAAFAGTVVGGDRAFELRTIEWAFFVQDDWKVTPNLTLNYGLRYEIFPGQTEADGRLANFDLQSSSVVKASGSGDRIIDTDTSNFGPRLGFAWTFGSNREFVLRGGYGLFYSQDGVDYPPLIRNPSVTSSVNFQGPAFGGSQNFNLTTGPPVASIVDPPVILSTTSLFVLEEDQKTASIHQWNLTLQWQFIRDWVLDVAYVGNRGRNLLATRQLGNNNNGLGLARTPGGTPVGTVIAYENRSSSQYDGLQAKLEKRMSHGFLLRTSYTWSHTIDDSTGVFGGAGDERGDAGGPTNPLSFRNERSDSSLDRRHTFNSSAIWDLPFGRDQYIGTGVSTAVNKLIGGWQANLLLSASTGQAYSPRIDGPSGGSTRPDLVSGCDPFATGNPSIEIDVACFVPPTQSITNLAGKAVFFGNLGRNAFDGPGSFRTDFSVFKNTRWGADARYTVQFGVAFFNLFNQTDNIVPNNNVNDPSSFGVFDNALPPRTIQYQLKFLF
ncbi:MAG: hypothetical protein V3R29_00520, partial [Candidatus Acidoferrales bacterium]